MAKMMSPNPSAELRCPCAHGVSLETPLCIECLTRVPRSARKVALRDVAAQSAREAASNREASQTYPHRPPLAPRAMERACEAHRHPLHGLASCFGPLA
eukprot:CAMPEP_0181291548 /NCGR_PEP_ID=MMETSP1101-20121128/2027_1 /TAXON_ID=46948 /ORGANISM="Rhodomonas abbreviata, Strain Caron Lab Isolate" /LENGTH=98 /DNA_ID=CAMNT_0023395949 /DNA_START=167 /DNA_END=463 /DNA_ORIENTATION=+